MALNFSHRPIFPAHLAEDNLVSPIRIANGYLVEGMLDKNGDGFCKPWHSNREVADCFDYGRERDDRGGSQQESASNDILDLLPSDPFGMDITTTFTAITGWLEDLEVGYGGYGTDEMGTSQGKYELFAGLNFIWNNAMRFQTVPWETWSDDKSDKAFEFGGCTEERELADPSCNCGFGPICAVEDVLSFGNENISGARCQAQESRGFNGSCYDGDGAAPHAAISFSLGYLGLRDLLSVEKVCRSLQSTVQNDPLLWRSIHVDQPLNERITDDILLQLTRRAQGNLQCLSLVECPRITDDVLKRVLESNPRLTKLCVPGCTRLSIDGVVNMLKAFQSTGTPGIKHLRIGGLYGVTGKHFEELKLLLGIDNFEKNAHKPHFYHRGSLYLLGDNDRAIDIETCPRCQNLRLVYDCPADGCQLKENAAQVCRACTLCIARCIQCGRCFNDSEYEETFCLEWLCSDCFKLQQQGQETSNQCLHG